MSEDPAGRPVYNSDTIIALATPSGIGAIGVIRLSDPDAISLVNEVFGGKDLSVQHSHTIHFGTIKDGSLNRTFVPVVKKKAS